jgi:hypothetical protein
VLDAIRARDEQIIRDGGPADRFLDVDIYQVDASALRGEQADAARDRDETRGGVLGAALDRVYDPALGGERALTDREANEIARAEDRQALHPHHDDGDPRDGIERRLELAHAEAAQDRAERADPNTARMVEARDQQAAGGRFDDADSTQRLIDAVREQPAAHELQGRTQDAARTLSVDAHGALLRSAFGAAPVEHRAEPAEPPVRETEPEVREL